MKKFECMSGQRVAKAQYDVWCNRKEFEFHSEYYEGTLNGSKVILEVSDYPNQSPVLSVYDDIAREGDLIEFNGLGTLVFIVDRITHYGSQVNQGMKISVLSGMENDRY